MNLAFLVPNRFINSFLTIFVDAFVSCAILYHHVVGKCTIKEAYSSIRSKRFVYDGLRFKFRQKMRNSSIAQNGISHRRPIKDSEDDELGRR